MHRSIQMTSKDTFTLYDYQVNSVNLLKDEARRICALDMGLGKTYVALALSTIWEWNQLVIVCPKVKLRKMSDTDDSWENMVQKYLWDDFKIPKQFTQEWIKTSPIIVINYDMFKKFKFKREATFIFDEIQKAKSHTSQIGKAVFNQTVNSERILCMSGDPYPQGYIDSFNLMRILTNTRLKYSWFKERYCDFYNNGIYSQLIGYKNTDEIINFMHSYGVWLKTEDVISLPEKIFIDIEYEPPKEFDVLLRDNVFEWDNKTIAATNPLTKLVYLRELSSGVLKLDNKWYSTSHSNKRDKVIELIESTDDKLVIFYNFTGELYHLRDKLENYWKVFEINGSKNEKQNFIDWPTKSILLCQYQSGSSAIDGLQNVTSHLICYSPTTSGENWKQMIKRIHRIGQKKTCYYYLLQDKLEKRIYKSLKKLENYTEEVFSSEQWT